MGPVGFLNAAMLLGLAGSAIPLLIHFLNRRRDPVVEWGAMQFLDIGRRATQKLRLTELLLMLARVGLLAAVALALARPFLAPGLGPASSAVPGGSGPARDVVLVLDGSASMGRSFRGETPKALAAAWARRFVASLGPGDSVGLLLAGDRVRPVLDPPVFDKPRALAAIDALERSRARGASDLPAAVAEAFRLLERGRNPAREVVVLTDGQRSAWRPGEAGRWGLVRDLARRMDVPPRVWTTRFGPDQPDPDDPPNGSVSALEVSRTLLTPGLAVTVSSELSNAGPGPLTRTAELLVDGRPAPGTSQVAGPVPPGGRAPLRFSTSIEKPGSHLLTVRLSGAGDPLPADDEASAVVEVRPALGVLMVDGEPGREPLGGETDFLRAALAPAEDEAPPARVKVIGPEALDASALESENVLVLANVERLTPAQAAAIGRFVESGGGVLVAPGDRVDPAVYASFGWMPARLGADVGGAGDVRSATARGPGKVAARPSPPSFNGPLLAPFARGDAPLGGAGLFRYRKLEPAPGAEVIARLDTGDPWLVERAAGRGRVLVAAGPLDAEGGTLPVNPDFVPLVHEWTLQLAGGAGPRPARPGEPIEFDLDMPTGSSPTSLDVLTPSGVLSRAVTSRAGGRLRSRFEDTSESGVYRLSLPEPPGGYAYAAVPTDPREADPSALDPAEAARLAEGWPRPLAFEPDPGRLTARVLAADGAPARREVWRGLVVLALCGLCLEVYLTRRLVRGQGLSA